jgi:hypothetical protein
MSNTPAGTTLLTAQMKALSPRELRNSTLVHVSGVKFPGMDLRTFRKQACGLDEGEYLLLVAENVDGFRVNIDDLRPHKKARL